MNHKHHRRLSKEVTDELAELDKPEQTKRTKKYTHGNIPTFEEVAGRLSNPESKEWWYPRKDFEEGFAIIPSERFTDLNGLNDVGANNIRERFGNEKDPVHFVMRTHVPGETLTEEHKKHYDDILKEGKVPIIGGYTNDEGKHVLDIGTAEAISDIEAHRRLQHYNQESSFRVPPTGMGSIFKNPKHKKPNIE
jgi:hypothetical protein